MKFKVGDKVRVTKAVTDHRAREVGKIYTVTNINRLGLEYYPRKNVNYYSFDDRETNYIFYEDELELISFAKSDLKDGRVVEIRNGKRFLVLNDKLIGKDSWMSIKHIHDDLSPNGDLTIDKVYATSAYLTEQFFDNKYLALIWERPKEEPAKKMTVEEIENELGYKVEIVSDSEK